MGGQSLTEKDAIGSEASSSCTQQEHAVLDAQLHGLSTKSDLGLASYATTLDVLVMIMGCLACVAAGALNPLLTVIYGQLVGAFQDFSNGSVSGSYLSSKVSQFSLYFVYLAIGMFVFVYAATVAFFFTGERVTQRLRSAYLCAVLRQNIAFFDHLGVGQVTERLTSDMHLVQEGISGKVSLTLTAAATFVTAYVITFVENWKLAFVLTSTLVAMTATNTLGTKMSVRYSKQAREAIGRSAEIVEEAVRSARHIAASGIQHTLVERYKTHLSDARSSAIKSRQCVALMISIFMGIMYLSSGLSFWQGSRFLVLGEMDGASIVTCSMAIVIGALAVGKVAPNAQAFYSSTVAAGKILETISRKSPQDPLSVQGLKPSFVRGHMELAEVDLIYPSRPGAKVLRELSLSFSAGKTTAIVGASGCGKSSIIGLLERFYTPTSGCITLDGKTLDQLNLSWLRQQMSLVSQEPKLFSTSIYDNICHGLAGVEHTLTPHDLRERVIQAAKDANAHVFIEALPMGYDTEVGESGFQLSGGQRQRIAIARAIVRDPKILLLDEATAALDTKAEKAVQKALQTAAQGRTTIVIAHRLSSIRDADHIYVLAKGKLAEQGTHESLMHSNGLYAEAVAKQGSAQPDVSDDEDNEDEKVVKIEEFQQTSRETGSKTIRGTIYSSDPAIDSDVETTQDKLEPSSHPSVASLIKLTWSMNSKDIPIIIMGLICCVIAGCIIPVQSVFFASAIDALSLPSSSYALLRSRINFWSLMYLMLGIVALLVWSGQGICLAYCSEQLTNRARTRAMQSMLRQDMAFFDDKANSPGRLSATLSTSASQLAGLNGAVLGTILTAFATLTGGIVLSLIIGWKLGLVCTSMIPLVLGCGYFRLRMLSLFEAQVRKTHASSAAYAAEAITAIRTVAALSLENHVINTYNASLETQATRSLHSILKASALYAASQSLVFLVASLGFWYGGGLIATHEYSLLQFFICFAALISGSQNVGAVFSFAPDMSKAIHAGHDLSQLFDRVPAIDVWDDSGDQIKTCEGDIELKNVSFRYASRQDSLVLDNISLTIKAGQFIALVGQSGCGKSTVISLLERFYDPLHGEIKLDGRRIDTLNLKDYRRLLSLVGQEPVVYQGTIKENLIMGAGVEVTEQEMIDACKEANIHDFIMSLPEGYSTEVGAQGMLLSGGQKQRVAIARALLRNTRILLLDEATSALDPESEAVVQEALDAASKQRTTIAVAHRLSTIERADCIYVLEKGRIIESGTHLELMATCGAYADLVHLQSLEEL